MPVKELDHRCFVLDYPAGASEDGRHFTSATHAESRAYYPYAGQVTARLLPHACHVVICDGPDCGEELENSDQCWTVHLASAADAGDAAAYELWTVTDDGVFGCYACTLEAGDAT